jgi:hypothetical protein
MLFHFPKHPVSLNCLYIDVYSEKLVHRFRNDDENRVARLLPIHILKIATHKTLSAVRSTYLHKITYRLKAIIVKQTINNILKLGYTLYLLVYNLI